MAGLFLWSGRHDEFSNGQKREIHSVSALRKIPMHGGGSELAAGLNHVMRGPRGSESLSEKIDFTPKGGEEEGKANQRGTRFKWSVICPARVKITKNPRQLHAYN